jgi:hypothetical protein
MVAGAAMSQKPAFRVSLMTTNHNAVGTDSSDYVSNIAQTPIVALGSFGDAGTARVAYRRIDRTQPQANR